MAFFLGVFLLGSESGRLVFPGDYLCSGEELAPGKHSYDSDGEIHADVIGIKNLDNANYEANVDPLAKEVKILERGSIVTGIVSLVKTHGVLVEIKSAEKNGEKRRVHDRNGAIAVFNIANSFVRETGDMYRAGDIVKARIIEVTPYGIELETKAPELGVIKAFGIRSRKPMHLIDGKLRDPVTGDAESRKISSEYLLR